MLCHSISFSINDLLAGETATHFHSPAAPGEDAGVRFPLSLGSPKTGCVGPLNEEDVANLNAGLFYFNVHSTMFPGGETRGQVQPIQIVWEKIVGAPSLRHNAPMTSDLATPETVSLRHPARNLIVPRRACIPGLRLEILDKDGWFSSLR